MDYAQNAGAIDRPESAGPSQQSSGDRHAVRPFGARFRPRSLAGRPRPPHRHRRPRRGSRGSLRTGSISSAQDCGSRCSRNCFHWPTSGRRLLQRNPAVRTPRSSTRSDAAASASGSSSHSPLHALTARHHLSGRDRGQVEEPGGGREVPGLPEGQRGAGDLSSLQVFHPGPGVRLSGRYGRDGYGRNAIP